MFNLKANGNGTKISSFNSYVSVALKKKANEHDVLHTKYINFCFLPKISDFIQFIASLSYLNSYFYMVNFQILIDFVVVVAGFA